MSDGKPLRESRYANAYGSYPGKVEFGCLHQTSFGGPMDRVFIESEEEAMLDVLGMRERGVRAVLVSRVVPEWTQIETTMADLRAMRDLVREQEEQARRAAAARQAAKERERREFDGDLTWKEL